MLGVLPQDRSLQVEVKRGRRKPSRWRSDELVMEKDRSGRDGLVLRLVPANGPGSPARCKHVCSVAGIGGARVVSWCLGGQGS